VESNGKPILTAPRAYAGGYCGLLHKVLLDTVSAQMGVGHLLLLAQLLGTHLVTTSSVCEDQNKNINWTTTM